MKKFFNAIAKKISSREQFNFEEGSRRAEIEERHLLFSKSVSYRLFDNVEVNEKPVAIYAKVGSVSKESIEAAKEAAKDYCHTGQVAKPNW